MVYYDYYKKEKRPNYSLWDWQTQPNPSSDDFNLNQANNISQPVTPQEPQDTLTLEYPALSQQINTALQQGWNRDDLRKFLAQRESIALLQYSHQEINQFLGRDENSVRNLVTAMQKQHDDAYVNIMKYDMSENKVRDILVTARESGIAPGVLLLNPDLLPEAEKLAGERRGFFGHVAGAFRNMAAHYLSGGAGATAFETQGLIQEDLNTADDNSLIQEGKRYLLDTQPDTDINNMTDEQLKDLGRQSLLQQIEHGKSMQATLQDYAASAAVHVRPPDSVIGATLINAIEQSGFTVASAIKSGIAWGVGGAIGGIFSAAFNTIDEARTEAGETFMEALRRGMSPEEAYERAKNTRNGNLFFLPVSNYGTDYLLHGMEQVWAGVADKIVPGAGWALRHPNISKFAKNAIKWGLPATLDAAIEGNEEYVQESLQMSSLGDEIDPNRLWQAFRMGMADAFIYSLVGMGTRKGLQTAFNITPYGKARLLEQQQQEQQQLQAIEHVKSVADTIKELQKLGEKIRNGDIQQDTVVDNDTVVFLPKSRIDDATADALGLQQEIMEDEEGNIITPDNIVTAEGIDNSEAAAFQDTEGMFQDEEQETIQDNDTDDEEVAVRKSTWDAFRADYPEKAQELLPYLREGTQGVTAIEQLTRKYNDIVQAVNDDSENQALQNARTKLEQQLIQSGRTQEEANYLSNIAAYVAQSLNRQYGIDFEQGMNIIVKPQNEENSNTPASNTVNDVSSATETITDNNTANPSTKTTSTKPVQNTPARSVTPSFEVIDAASKKGGNVARIRTIKGTEVDVRYRIVEADDLIASTLETGAPNPAYPQELQPRNRGREASHAQIAKIAANLDPEMLAEDRLASGGAPVIGYDNVVESGNGRVMAIRRAYNTGAADNYKTWIVQNAPYYGIKQEDAAKLRQPVLVRERISDVDRVKFTSEANESNIAQMSNTEIALGDARRLTNEILSLYDPNRELASNKLFIQAFAGLVPENERGDFFQQNGDISTSGLTRIKNALAAKAYNDTGILNRLSEVVDDEVKNISNALVTASPHIAVFENSGYSPDLSIRDDIMQAVNMMLHLKSEGSSVAEFLSQLQLFDDYSKEMKLLLKFFDDNKRSAKRIALGLITYAQMAEAQPKQGQGMLFDDLVRSKKEILQDAIKFAEQDKNSDTETQSKKTAAKPKKTSGILNLAKFKKWFGDWKKYPYASSKAVDDSGKPIHLFHGTNLAEGQAPFTVFDMHGKNISKNTGAWFTSNKKAAQTFGNFVYEVFLNIRKPYIVYSKDSKKSTMKMDDIVRDVKAGKYGKGYDGVIFRNVMDVLDFFNFSSEQEAISDVYVVFKPEQIKSVDNNGNWDTNDKDIYHQIMYRGTRFNMEGDASIHRGKGDGRSLYGAGLYLSESMATAQHFRLAGFDELERVTFTNNNGSQFTYNFDDYLSDFFAKLAENEIKRDKGDKRPSLHEYAEMLIQQEIKTLETYEKNLERQKAKTDNKNNINMWKNVVKGQKKKIATLRLNIPASASLATLEGYNQVGGVVAAQNFDRANGSNVNMQNLDVAKQMMEAGKDAKTIRLATGWELAPDGEWRLEFNDGSINIPAIFEALQDNEDGKFELMLADFFDAPELFTAYPQLKNLRVVFHPNTTEGYNGVYHEEEDINERYITLSTRLGRSIWDIQSTLRHELQHAVQHIEGFASGGESQNIIIEGDFVEQYGEKLIHERINRATENVQKVATLYLKRRIREAEKLAATLSQAELQYWRNIKEDIDHFYDGHFRLPDTYGFIGGEVEARNVQARENFSDEERRNTTLADTQNTDMWLISNGKNRNFYTVQDLTNSTYETYNQATFANRDGVFNGLQLPFSPDDLTTESGTPIHDAKPNELLLTPDGSPILGTIPDGINGFPAGNIQANAGVVHYIENKHGQEIHSEGYDAVSLLLDVLNNYSEIHKASNNALMLSTYGDSKKSIKSIVKLVEDTNGIYRVSDAGIVRNDYISKKELLYTRSESHVTVPDSGSAFFLRHSQGQGLPVFDARRPSNFDSLNGNNQNVNNGNEQYNQTPRNATPKTKGADNLNSLLALNSQVQQQFSDLLHNLQSQLGGVLVLREGLKKSDRITEKANNSFGGDFGYITDVLAGTLVFDNDRDILDAVDKLKKRKDVVRIKNNWDTSDFSGMRNFLVNIKLSNGVIAELQLQDKDTHQVYNEAGHSLYEFTRKNMNNPEMQEQFSKAINISRTLYNSAFNGSYSALDENTRNAISDNAQKLSGVTDTQQADLLLYSLSQLLQQKSQNIDLTSNNETINASTSWPKGISSRDAPSLIEFFSTANKSSGFHELGHHIIRVLTDAAQLDNANDLLKNDVNMIFNNAGVHFEDFVNNKADSREKVHEYFARAFETYLSEGKAPNQELQGAFDRIKSWLIDVYHNVVQALGIQLNDELRDFFDRLLEAPDSNNDNTTLKAFSTAFNAAEAEINTISHEIEQLENMLTSEQEAYNQSSYERKIEQLQKKIERLENEQDQSKQHRKDDALKLKQSFEERIKRLKQKQSERIKQVRQQGRERQATRIAKLKQHVRDIKQRQRERKAIREKTKKMIKRISRMSQDTKSISWNRHQQILDLLSNYDLKRYGGKNRQHIRFITQEFQHRQAIQNQLQGFINPNISQQEIDFFGLNDKDLLYLSKIPNVFDFMTFDDLRYLFWNIKQLYDTGRRELSAKKMLDFERIKAAREQIRQIMSSLPQPKNNGTVRSHSDLSKQYEGIKGFGQKIIDWAASRTLGAQRFFDTLDNNQGHVWRKIFVDDANTAYDTQLRYKFSRLLAMEKTMADLGITPQMLNQTRDVDVPHIGNRAWTLDELLSIYAGMQNQKSSEAILYGNFRNAGDQAEEWAAKCIQALSDNERALADAVIQEYEQNFDRINQALIDTYNQGMVHEENYTPMRRLEYTSSNRSMIDPDSAENLLSSQAGSGMSTVQRGFSQKRRNFAKQNQNGIQLGLLSIWHSQVDAQEHAAAFGQYVRDLRRILLGRDENSPSTIRQLVKQVYGKYAWETIREYFNVIAANDTQNAYDTLDGISRYLAKNMSIAYLCGNLGTAIKQTNSFFRVIPYAGPTSMINAIGQFIQNPNQFMQDCYSLDPQLKNRRGDPLIQALRQENNGLYQQLLNHGSELIGFTDRVTAAISFKAVYDANIKHGLSQEQAIKEAQRVVLLTQPATQFKDKPLIWRQHGYARLMMMFTNDMAQTFGITAYDLSQALRRGEYPKALGHVLGVTLAAMLIKALSSGLPDEPDDPDEWAKWVASALTEQEINSIPLIGKELMTLWDSRRGYLNNNSAFVAPLAKLLAGSKGLWDDKNDNNERAIINLIEGGSLLAPFPATALKRLWYMAKYSGKGEVLNAVKSLLGTHIQDKKLKKAGNFR